MSTDDSRKSNSNDTACSATLAPHPSEALMQLLAPDGYYTYLQIEKPANEKDEVDSVLLKKNYRKLSLKHHPDRRGGDEETFRALNRAQFVLCHSKLRQQYDLLGIDLEEDEDHSHSQEDSEKTEEQKEREAEEGPPTLVKHMASAALAGVLQSVVRTGKYVHGDDIHECCDCIVVIINLRCS